MRMARLVLNAAVLAGISLASILCGFWVYRLLGSASQLAVQVPVALVCGVAGIVVWLKCFRRLHALDPGVDYVPVIVLAFPVCAVLVVGVHYLVTGYLTALGNVVGAWFVLFAEALVAMPIAAAGGTGRAVYP